MFNKQFHKRFWNKVQKSSPNECWLWTAGKNKRGQGFFRVNYNKRKMDMAYRVSWMIEHKTIIPHGMEIMHSCDNPSCVNPKHLAIGTHAENMRDMMGKGRHRTDNKKGEEHYSAKLSEADIKNIRASKLSQTALAKQYGVSQHCIWCIVRRKSWTHIS